MHYVPERNPLIPDPPPPPPEGQPHLIPIVVGDASGDSTQRTERFYCWSNVTSDQWTLALERGQQRLSLDLDRVMGHPEVSVYVLRFLQEAGWTGRFQDQDGVDEKDDSAMIPVCAEDYLAVTLFVISRGNPNLRWTLIPHGEFDFEVRPGGARIYP